MKIFALSGLGADKRVFQYLTLDHEVVPLEWIKEQPHESITEYATRLIQVYNLDQEQDFGVLGVSFGGLVAVEISKILNPKVTILISSVETKHELNIFYKLAGILRVNELVPKSFLNPPKFIAHFAFGTKEKKLLNAILDDTDLNFAKWGVRALLNWDNTTKITNLIKIGGTQDKLLYPKGRNNHLVKNGQHLMIVDRAQEVSDVINMELAQLH